MKLSRRLSDGSSLADHLKVEAAATGRADPLLQMQVPDGGDGVWQLYLQLDATRGEGMSGPGPITHTEMCAWERLMRVRLNPWEVETINLMDRAARSAAAAQQATVSH